MTAKITLPTPNELAALKKERMSPTRGMLPPLRQMHNTVLGAYVSSDRSRDYLQGLVPRLPIIVDGRMFFQ